MNNICKIEVNNRTKPQQLKMLMQYNNAGNITVLHFRIFPDKFSISSLCMRFSKLYKSPRPCAFTAKLKPASQSITQILIFVLSPEQHYRNHKHRMKRGMCPAIGIYNTDPTSCDSWGKGTQSQGEEFGFWVNQSWRKLYLVQQTLLLGHQLQIFCLMLLTVLIRIHMYIFPRERRMYTDNRLNSAKKPIIRLF